jgi:RNA polymerase sigma factor (sigma-70 family)
LLRKARRILQNSEDAQDLVHGLFLDLLGKGALDVDLAYLYRAVTHRALNLLRDRQNRQRLLERQDAFLRGPVRTRCDELVVGLDLLARLVTRLSPEEAEALVLHFYDDLTQAEIAEVTGVSRKTVGKRLAEVSAAVRALRAEAHEVTP